MSNQNALRDLPMDVFELEDQSMDVSSLTAGHGMTEVGASTNCFCYPLLLLLGAVQQRLTSRSA